MTPRKQMALKARTTCPVCESARLEGDGLNRTICRSCGHRFEAQTGGK